jgi:hypothetical protein
VAEAFINDMTQGNVTAAMSKCDSTMPQSQLDSAAQQMQQWGPLQQLVLMGVSVDANSGGTNWELVGSAAFAKGGPKPATFTLRKQADGSYKIVKFKFE